RPHGHATRLTAARRVRTRYPFGVGRARAAVAHRAARTPPARAGVPAAALTRAALAAACLALALPARAVELPAEVARALSGAGIPASSSAVWVQEISAPAPAVAHNPRVPMNPASTIKLVT